MRIVHLQGQCSPFFFFFLVRNMGVIGRRSSVSRLLIYLGYLITTLGLRKYRGSVSVSDSNSVTDSSLFMFTFSSADVWGRGDADLVSEPSSRPPADSGP